MRTTRLLTATVAALFCATVVLPSAAQDDGDTPPAPLPPAPLPPLRDAPPPPESSDDEADGVGVRARPTLDELMPPVTVEDKEILRRAAEKQTDARLDAEGISSLVMTFGRVQGRRTVTQDDGNTRTEVFDTTDAWFAWRANEAGLSASFVEHAVIDGRAQTRCIHPPRRVAWMRTGENTLTVLKPESHDEDLRQIARNRRVVSALRDLLLLKRTMGLGGTWHVVEDGTHTGRGYLHRPKRGSRSVPFVVWIDSKTFDPVAVRLPPLGRGEPAQDVELTFHDRLPRIEGATVRVPFRMVVRNQAPGRKPDPEPVLDLRLTKVSFAPLPDSRFAARQTKATAPGTGAGTDAPR